MSHDVLCDWAPEECSAPATWIVVGVCLHPSGYRCEGTAVACLEHLPLCELELSEIEPATVTPISFLCEHQARELVLVNALARMGDDDGS